MMSDKQIDIDTLGLMTWRGEDVAKMTKKELIQALYEMATLYEQECVEQRTKAFQHGLERTEK
jgi:hypothetical protein